MGDERYLQVVPRPEGSELGPPPPWTVGLSPETVHARLAFPALIEALRPSLLAPDDPSLVEEAPSAAVLVPLFGCAGETSVLLIRRAASLRQDPSHIAFPGGWREPGEHPVATALREAHEEIGLAPDAVDVLGVFRPVHRRRDRTVVLPVVGVCPGLEGLVPSEAEVDALLEVPLAALVDEGVAWQERWGTGAEHRTVRFFASETSFGGDLIWGLTAGMLWDLLERVLLPGAA